MGWGKCRYTSVTEVDVLDSRLIFDRYIKVCIESEIYFTGLAKSKEQYSQFLGLYILFSSSRIFKVIPILEMTRLLSLDLTIGYFRVA